MGAEPQGPLGLVHLALVDVCGDTRRPCSATALPGWQRPHRRPRHRLPWQRLAAAVPLMWKPGSQRHCWVRSTWAQRGLRLKAGSAVALKGGGTGGHRGAMVSAERRCSAPIPEAVRATRCPTG